jgi:hypothetical protein
METHAGGCHCGKVRYGVDLDLAKPVIECNCSHCQIKGLLLSFVPAESFTLVSREPALTEYRFNTEKIQHLFCSACGVESFGRGSDANEAPTVAINVRTIDGIDLSTLNRMPYDGRSR